jgi:asparagine synthase (glutamine-hydrolysing)
MCGIAGVIGENLAGNEEDIVHTMIKSLQHRGPDNIGFFSDKDCIIAHSRLSIIDLSEKANQPMTDDKGDIVLVFNGEIYNHAEIRKRLEKKYKFKTDHSDTETIIFAYREWGIDFLKYVNGMFAIALIDKNKRKLFLIRDRFGKKPIFYTIMNNKIFFASEIRAFFAAHLIEKEINTEALYHYLTYLSVMPPQTLFNNVSKVRSSSYIIGEFNGGRIKIAEKGYYDISNILNQRSDYNFKEIVHQAEKRLVDSIALRNVSDVTVAVSLSGGIDSSMNLVLSKKINPNIKAINISLKDVETELDESIFAERLANDLDIPIIKLKLDVKDFIKKIDELSKLHIDTPIVWPDMLLMYEISRNLKNNGIKVVLVGEGGDELSAYPHYFSVLDNYRKFRKYGHFKKSINLLLPRVKPNFDYFYDNELLVYRNVFGLTERIKKNSTKNVNSTVNSYRINKTLMDEIKINGEEGYIRKILNIEYKFRLPELLLPRIDYSTMLNSVEARAPFLDYKLVETCVKTSFFERNKDSELRKFQKEVAKKYLPKYILNKPKSGFGEEFVQARRHELLPYYNDEILYNDSSFLKEYITNEALGNIKSKYYKKNKDILWIFYTLEKWLNRIDQIK